MNGALQAYGAACGLRELQNPKTMQTMAIIQNRSPMLIVFLSMVTEVACADDRDCSDDDGNEDLIEPQIQFFVAVIQQVVVLFQN